MNRIVLLILTVLAVFCAACDLSVLSGDNRNADPAQEDLATADATLLNVEITGGIAGVQRNFHVTRAGTVQFTDSLQPGARWTSLLTSSQLETLKKLMSDNAFFQLGSSYIDPQVADAFIYTIFYQQDEQSKTVQTDSFAAPENLRTIIAGLLSVITQTTESGLELDLRLSKTQIGPDETVEVTLLATNILDTPITLHFKSGQIFDFLVVQEPPAGSLAPEVLLWNWAYDKAFTQQIWQLQIEPGETKSYEVTWDGKDNNGNSLEGRFAVRAALVSMPGGSPEQKYIVIENQ